jgi:hypothetical protein
MMVHNTAARPEERAAQLVRKSAFEQADRAPRPHDAGHGCRRRQRAIVSPRPHGCTPAAQ